MSPIKISITADDKASGTIKEVTAGLRDMGSSGGILRDAFAFATGGALLGGIQAIGGAITGVAGSTVTMAADFEKTMSGIKSVSGATVVEMDQLNAKALQLGADTAFSASEAAAGMEELIKGGVGIPDIMNGAAESMLNLAAAGGVEIPDAAEIAANAMAMFNIDGAGMADVANQIAGAANASSLSVTDFKFSLGAVGSVAATAGQSFESTATAIAVMGLAGIKGSDAGTSLKTMLMNLIPTTNAAKEQFSELGITGFDSAKALQFLAENGVDTTKISMDQAQNAMVKYLQSCGQLKGSMEQQAKTFQEVSDRMGLTTNAFINADGSFKSMAEISEVLKTKTADLTESQRLLALETMFGSDAVRAAAIFSKEGAAGFEEMAAGMGKVTAESVAADRLNNYAGAVDTMNGSIETLKISVGQHALPVLTQFINDGITPGINAVTTFAQEVLSSSDPLATFGQRILAMMPSADQIGTTLQTIQVVMLAWIVAQAPAIGAGILEWVNVFIGWVTPMIPPLLAALQTISLQIASWIIVQAPGWGAQLLVWGQTFIGWVAPMIPPVLSALGGLATQVWSWISAQAAPLVASFASWASGMIAWIPGATTTFLQQWPGMLNSFLTWIGAQAGPILVKVGEWGVSMIKWIGPMIPGFLAALAGISVAILTFVAETAVVLAGKLIEWGAKFIGWVATNVLPELPGVLAQIATGLWSFVSTTATTATDKLRELAAKFLDWVQADVLPKLPGVLDTIKTAISGWISGAAGWAAGALVSIGASIIQSLITGIMSKIGEVKSKLSELTSLIPSWKGPPERDATLLFGAGQLILQSLLNGMSSMFPQIRETLRAVTADTAEATDIGDANTWSPVIDNVRVNWQSIGAAIQDPMRITWSYIQSVTDLIIRSVKDAKNAVDSLPKGGGGSGGTYTAPVATVQLRGYASGGRNISGGTILVGENGPEVVNVPNGTNVYNNRETRGMMGGLHIGQLIVHAGSGQNGGQIADELMDQMIDRFNEWQRQQATRT